MENKTASKEGKRTINHTQRHVRALMPMLFVSMRLTAAECAGVLLPLSPLLPPAPAPAADADVLGALLRLSTRALARSPGTAGGMDHRLPPPAAPPPPPPPPPCGPLARAAAASSSSLCRSSLSSSSRCARCSSSLLLLRAAV